MVWPEATCRNSSLQKMKTTWTAALQDNRTTFYLMNLINISSAGRFPNGREGYDIRGSENVVADDRTL